jgi:hypothetical protein
MSTNSVDTPEREWIRFGPLVIQGIIMTIPPPRRLTAGLALIADDNPAGRHFDFGGAVTGYVPGAAPVAKRS